MGEAVEFAKKGLMCSYTAAEVNVDVDGSNKEGEDQK